MRNFLGEYFHVECADSTECALEMLTRGDSFELIIADANLPPASGIEFIMAARRRNPRQRVALLSRIGIEDSIAVLRKNRIYTAFIKTTPFDFDEFLLVVENLLNPLRAFGAERYLREPFQLQEFKITTRTERHSLIEQAMTFYRRFRSYDTDVTEIRLVCDELINNAIYHAFKNSAGEDKYRPGAFMQLAPEEQVTVQIGHDSNNLLFSVTDNQGTLDIDTVLYKMERQLSLEGLLDESGRGFHLTRTIADRMIINLRPRKSTQIILLFSHRPGPRVRPLYINSISENV